MNEITGNKFINFQTSKGSYVKYIPAHDTECTC